MLYLEDFIELIDVYPDINKERLAEMRVLDLEIENAMADMRKAREAFFKRCPNLDEASRKKEYHEIVTKVFVECLEKADEKVQSASKLCDMLDRYLYKQKMELQKFKFELEADNAGVTEALERKVEEDAEKQQQMLRHQRIERKRNRSALNSPGPTENGIGPKVTMNGGSGMSEKRQKNSDVYRPSGLDDRPTATAYHRVLSSDKLQNGVSPHVDNGISSERDGTPYIRHVGTASNNAIVAAASQAIAATQQMQQGRRSASLKASYAAVAKGTAGFQHYFSNSSHSGQSSLTTSKMKRDKKFPKLKLHRCGSSSSLSSLPTNPSGGRKVMNQALLSSSYSGGAGKGSLIKIRPISSDANQNDDNDDDDDDDDEEDSDGNDAMNSSVSINLKHGGPNRAGSNIYSGGGSGRPGGDDAYSDHGDNQLYCKCRQVSYGDMVACDNPDCPIEWFHYECVKLSSAPKGKWFCPDCTISMKRRGIKK